MKEKAARPEILQYPQKEGVGWVRRFSTLVGLVLICLVLTLTSKHFFSFENFINVLLQNANIAILAAGLTLVILLGEIDLSVGGVEALGCVVAAWMMVYGGLGMFPSILLGLLAGTLCGLVSGFFVAYFRFHSFVSTLAMMGIARGFALIYTHGASIYGLPDTFRFMGQGSIGPIPVPVLIAAVVLLLVHLLLTQVRLGNHIYAVGGNIEAARLAGINVGKVKLIVLSISGLCSGLAGVIMASRLNSGQGTIGETDLLDALASVIIGGTSLMGGVGTIPGTILGVLIISVIRNGLNLLGVSSFWQMVAIGAIIICAVLIEEIRRKLQEKER